MNWVDAVILAILVWFTYAAFNAGLIREIITILGAIFAVALAGLLYTDLAKDIDVAVNNSDTSKVIAFGVIFGAVILASQLMARGGMTRRTIQHSGQMAIGLRRLRELATGTHLRWRAPTARSASVRCKPQTHAPIKT